MKIYKRPGLLLLVFYLTISAVWGQKNVKGSGYVLTQQRETADFTSIEISRGIDVAIVRGEMEPITVEADDNLFSYIKTTVKNKVLKIYIPDSVNIVKYASMNVLISMPTLGSLKASNHSRIDAWPQIWNLRTIRLEATTQGGTLRAAAEVQVPQPPQDFRVDTCTVPINMGSGIVTPHRRYLVTMNDIANESNHYRLDIRNQFLVRYHIYEYLRDEQGNFIEDENHNLIYTERDSLTTQIYSDLVNREDIILTDGNISHSQEDEDNLMFPRIENKYNIFTDNRFRNSSATLKVYTRLYDDFTANALHGITYGKTYCTQSIHIRLLNLTADYYRYLKALNCLDDDDYDTTLMEPVSLPCNVSGGIGFVGVATPREVVITFPERPCRNTSSSSL